MGKNNEGPPARGHVVFGCLAVSLRIVSPAVADVLFSPYERYPRHDEEDQKHAERELANFLPVIVVEKE